MAASISSSGDSLATASSAGLLLRLWQSSLGKKYVMAVTGLGLYGFVVIHLLGNLQIFAGETAINEYAHALKANPVILWGARFGLLTIVTLHIVAALQLAAANKKARPMDYAVGKPVASTLAQRTILVSGLVILSFIIFHLAHFTLGWVNPELLTYEAGGIHDVRRMMIEGLSNPIAALFYIISMGLLMLHLSHGVSSLFQSLGLRSKKTVAVFDKLAKASGLLLFLGNTAIVLAVLFGLIR
ncbi:MAG: succinate dehydrogenase cytochrome b subunit [Acidobacteria bacterium]|nr:succinate dehydrogenase cytochrome b subunit [Acidobacteriota bacterium]